MILIGALEINGKTFTMEDSRGAVYPHQLNLPDSFYGGYAKEFRKTDYGIYLILNERLDIINLGYMPSGLSKKGRELLEGTVEAEETEEPEFYETEPFPPVKKIKTSFLENSGTMKESVGTKKNKRK